MSVRKPNVELLDATLAEVRKAARRKGDSLPRWDQTEWRWETPCGTAMCFAGWAAELSGTRWLDQYTTCTPARGQTEQVAVDRKGRRYTHAWARAEYSLGLTEGEAEILFDGANTLRDLSRIVKQIKAGKLR